VAERADGLTVREDDAEPEPLDDESMLLADGAIVAMAVKELPFLWRTCPADRVTLSEGGVVATQTAAIEESLTTTGIAITEGTHYWEVELLSKNVANINIGISRPNLDPTGCYSTRDCADGWFINAYNSGLWGNGKHNAYNSGLWGGYTQRDRVGMLLDLDNGSLRFFKNGVENGPGYPAGSVTGPVVAAVQMFSEDAGVRLLPDAEAPAGKAGKKEKGKSGEGKKHGKKNRGQGQPQQKDSQKTGKEKRLEEKAAASRTTRKILLQSQYSFQSSLPMGLILSEPIKNVVKISKILAKTSVEDA
jgi:hypothetical protein